MSSLVRLSVYFGESLTFGHELAADALMARLSTGELACSALLRGIEGYGVHRRLHFEQTPDLSADVPLVALGLGSRAAVEAALGDVDAVLTRGLVTLRAAGESESSAQLTLMCATGDRAAYRSAVAALAREGAASAVVLPGIDGALAGRRGRAELFARNHGTPVVLLAVGPSGVLERCAAGLPGAVSMLEPVVVVKEHGSALAALPAAGGFGWQAVYVYTRRATLLDGRPLHRELVGRLRAAGAAGATTVLGDWGFLRGEPPHGDNLGRVASHRTACTVWFDAPERVAELWPVVDEATAEHGIVVALPVLGYRERTGDVVHGALSLS